MIIFIIALPVNHSLHGFNIPKPSWQTQIAQTTIELHPTLMIYLILPLPFWKIESIIRRTIQKDRFKIESHGS